MDPRIKPVFTPEDPIHEVGFEHFSYHWTDTITSLSGILDVLLALALPIVAGAYLRHAIKARVQSAWK